METMSENRTDDEKLILDLEPKSRNFVIPIFDIPCPGDDDYDENAIPVAVQPPTPLNMTPMSEKNHFPFPAVTIDTSAVEEVEPRENEEVVMRRDSNGVSAATLLEQTCLKDLQEAAQRLETLENDLKRSGSSTPCDPEKQYAVLIDTTEISNAESNSRKVTATVDGLATQLEHDLISECLAESTVRLRLTQNKIETNLDNFNLSMLQHDKRDQVVRARSALLDRDHELGEQVEKIATMRSKSLEDCCIEVEGESVAVIAAHMINEHGSKVDTKKDWAEIPEVKPEANPFVPENPFFTAPPPLTEDQDFTKELKTETIEENEYPLPSIRRSLSTYDVIILNRF